jgi:large subunit ribosomal protein L2
MQNFTFKKIRPVTPSLRSLKKLKLPFISSLKPIKSKTFFFKKRMGRNQKGMITLRHRGGGHKKLYRSVDFKRLNGSGIVEAIEYDPFRTAFLARIYEMEEKKRFYILAPKNLCVGAIVRSGLEAEIKLGHSLPLLRIPVGSLIHNISVAPGKIGQYVRAAGTCAQLIQKTKSKARIRLCSGVQRLVPLTSHATLGAVSNENSNLSTLGKAGRNRWYGRRPYVRGVAMNPVDHPHGGGEGKSSGGRPSVTPWGKPTKGPKTSRSRNPFIVVPRNKKK